MIIESVACGFAPTGCFAREGALLAWVFVRQVKVGWGRLSPVRDFHELSSGFSRAELCREWHRRLKEE
jgi:hypothetical protein